MNAVPERKSMCTAFQLFGLLLVIASLGRLVTVVPDWVGGEPPAYPGQYERRLFGALTSVPLMSAFLLTQRREQGAPTRGRRALVWALLAISVIALILDVLRG